MQVRRKQAAVRNGRLAARGAGHGKSGLTRVLVLVLYSSTWFVVREVPQSATQGSIPCLEFSSCKHARAKASGDGATTTL